MNPQTREPGGIFTGFGVIVGKMMDPIRPLPIDNTWESPDVYVDALLAFATTNVLFQNLCGGVHMVDFLTREPDVYTTLLPENWRSFFDQHDVQDIINLLLRDNIDQLQDADRTSDTWNEGACPPQSLLDYISTVRRLILHRDLPPSSLERIDLPTQVAMRMNRKKVHEVQCLSQYIASLSDTVRDHRGQSVSHIVDFGSGQNYLGRTLVSPPYHKHVIAIERTHQYITGAKGMDVRAKLARDPKARDTREVKYAYDEQDQTTRPFPSDVKEHVQSSVEDPQVSGDANGTLSNKLGQINLGPDEPLQKQPLPSEIATCGTLSYVEHDIQDGYLEPIIDHIINPSSDAAEKDEDAQVMIVSLHSCGNLVHHGLRSLVLNPSIVAVAMIGCCYNLITERLGPATSQLPVLKSLHPRLEKTGSSYDPHGFPMSKFYENYQSPGTDAGMRLNITARALAVQAPHNWTQKDCDVSFTRHFFRALLERILVDRNVIPKPSSPEETSSDSSHSGSKAEALIIGSVPKSAYKAFKTYVRAATTKMGQDPVYGSRVQDNVATLTDEEIDNYETQYSQAKKHIGIMWSLMAFSAQLVESIIVVDRWQYLREQDSVKECWVEPVFDYAQSPRNLAVIGLKK